MEELLDEYRRMLFLEYVTIGQSSQVDETNVQQMIVKAHYMRQLFCPSTRGIGLKVAEMIKKQTWINI